MIGWLILVLRLFSIPWFFAPNWACAVTQEVCPGKPHAHVIDRTETPQSNGTTRRTTRCDCDDGYENQEGVCVALTPDAPPKWSAGRWARGNSIANVLGTCFTTWTCRPKS